MGESLRGLSQPLLLPVGLPIAQGGDDVLLFRLFLQLPQSTCLGYWMIFPTTLSPF